MAVIPRIACLLALIVASAAFAQDRGQAELDAAFVAARKVARAGPTEVKLADQAVLRLPAGQVFIPVPQAGSVLTAMGNRPGEGLLGLVFPADDGGWFVVARRVNAGFVKDDDAKNWDAKELLESLKSGTESMNEERRARGIGEVEITGWLEPPAYDAGTHRLVWSIASREKGGGGQGVNYNTYALGREGYISLNLVTGQAQFEKFRPVAKSLLASLEYNTGKKYTDFDAGTDRVAEYGIAALIGGIAAKKLGMFALAAGLLVKFWKILLIAGIALIGVLAKLKGRKSPPRA